MLFELETETAKLNREEYGAAVASQEYSQQHQHGGFSKQDEYDEFGDDDGEEEEEEEVSVEMEEESTQSDSEGETFGAPTQGRQQPQQAADIHIHRDDPDREHSPDEKLGEVCYKSLSIGLHLAKKMDQVLEDFRNLLFAAVLF